MQELVSGPMVKKEKIPCFGDGLFQGKTVNLQRFGGTQPPQPETNKSKDEEPEDV